MSDNDEPGRRTDGPGHVEEHAGGEIQERRGRVNLWLGVVYLVLFVWALYYLFAYWGGLGPGLDY